MKNKVYHFSRLSLFALLLQVSMHLAGADINYWTGTAADGLWSTPSNWSLNTPPDADDEVMIDLAGTYTVQVDTNVDCSKLTVGG